MTTRTGAVESLQISKFDILTLENDFELESGESFLIKNESFTSVELEVVPDIGTDWVTVLFDHGWNEELVRKVKATEQTTRLIWGV